jgi:hypothetical protein
MSYLRNIKLSPTFQDKSMSWEKVNPVVGIIGLGVAVAALLLQASDWKWKPTLFGGANDRFSCQRREYPEENSTLYTVMYRSEKGTQPWMRMVNTFGNNWGTPQRCEAIAQRLEDFRKDGLLELTYRDDPNTPNQAVICAITKSSGKNCELLVTLTPGANGYESLKKSLVALETGNTVDHNSNGGSSATKLSLDSPSVPLVNFLADEDQKAGSVATK